MSKEPFFIVGCPRSGTSLLRDALDLHPNFACPEETFFFSWSATFGSPVFNNVFKTDDTSIHHRKLDGISEEEFDQILNKALSRKELQDLYMKLFLLKSGNLNARWFDKSPQNVFGIPLLLANYPGSKIIHIHRHPFDVIASIVEGKAIANYSLIGAINLWCESMTMGGLSKETWPDRIIEIRFKDFTSSPRKTLDHILQELGEDPAAIDLPERMVRIPDKRYREILTEKNMELILTRCLPFMEKYNYPVEY